MAPGVGFEPTANALTAHCSTTELPGIMKELAALYEEKCVWIGIFYEYLNFVHCLIVHFDVCLHTPSAHRFRRAAICA